MTLAISGRIGRDSLASAALQRSLESRLMTRLDTAGSTLFKLTWKRRRTPLGRSYLERAVSAARTSGSGFTSWPTPKAQWVTPSARDRKDSAGMAETGTNPDGTERSRLDQLPRQANLAVWPTPMAGSPGSETYNEAGNTDSSRRTVELAAWPTPNAMEGGQTSRGGSRKDELLMGGIAQTASFDPARIADTDPLVAYGIEVARTNGWQAFGIVLTSSTAGIRIVPAGGRLRAGHSRWLMAIPAAWDGFACTAMQSMSKSPRRSSKRTSKAKEKPNEPIA